MDESTPAELVFTATERDQILSEKQQVEATLAETLAQLGESRRQLQEAQEKISILQVEATNSKKSLPRKAKSSRKEIKKSSTEEQEDLKKRKKTSSSEDTKRKSDHSSSSGSSEIIIPKKRKALNESSASERQPEEPAVVQSVLTQSQSLNRSTRLTDSVLRFHREVSTGVARVPKQIIVQEPCSICLMDEPLHSLEGCNHKFCAACLGAYFGSCVAELDLPIKCPEKGCGLVVSTDDVERYSTPMEFQKFTKFMMKLERPELRDCPVCSTMNQPEGDTNKIVCSKCAQIYCLLHSNAHPPTISCYQYEKNLRKKDKKNSKVLKQTRRCPKCGIYTERTEGCPMMTCSQCEAKWCYLCGAFVKGNSEAGYRCPDCGASAFRHKKDPTCASCVCGIICFPLWGTCGLLYSVFCGPLCCCIAMLDDNTSFEEAYQLCCCPFDIVKDWFWCPCCYTDHNKLYEKRSEKIWGKEMEDTPFVVVEKKSKKSKNKTPDTIIAKGGTETKHEIIIEMKPVETPKIDVKPSKDLKVDSKDTTDLAVDITLMQKEIASSISSSQPSKSVSSSSSRSKPTTSSVSSTSS